MQALQKLKRHLRPDQVYRRADLAKFSNSVDRHLRQLVEAGELKKIRTGIYHRPKQSIFGEVPADDRKLVAAFLQDDDFLMLSLNDYNGLELGTTQLYNEQLVYNHKRNGRMKLDGQNYFFLKNRKFPKKITEVFLLIDMVNNLEFLAEDLDTLKRNIAQRACELGIEKVCRAAKAYGKVTTKKYFEQLFQNRASING